MSGKVTKEFALILTPFMAAYLFIVFYEAGYSNYFGIPYSLISVNVVDVILTNRFALFVAALAFLWTGLYYNFLPSIKSPIFKGIVSGILFFTLWAGYTLGTNDAKHKEYFLTSSMANTKQVVIRIYNNNAIMMPATANSKILKRIYSFKNIANSKPSDVFVLEKIGPLSVEGH